MQVYKTFFLMLKKQKGMILMYLGIFVAVAWLVAGQGQKNEEKQFQKESYTFAVLDHDDTEISRGQPIWEKNTNRWKSGTMKN